MDPILLQNALDDVVVKNTMLTHELQALQQRVSNTELQYESQLLDKDIKIAKMEADLVTLRVNERSVVSQLAQVHELQETIGTLTQWHAVRLFCGTPKRPRTSLRNSSKQNTNSTSKPSVWKNCKRKMLNYAKCTKTSDKFPISYKRTKPSVQNSLTY